MLNVFTKGKLCSATLWLYFNLQHHRLKYHKCLEIRTTEYYVVSIILSMLLVSCLIFNISSIYYAFQGIFFYAFLNVLFLHNCVQKVLIFLLRSNTFCRYNYLEPYCTVIYWLICISNKSLKLIYVNLYFR